MTFNDSITPPTAPHDVETVEPSRLHEAGAPHSARRVLSTLWRGLRQLAWGIDAFSRVTHGIDVPPDHGARSRPWRATRHP